MAKKCTKVEKARRVDTFVRLISNGAVNSDLIRYASVEWGLTSRMAENYIAEARKVIIQDIDQERPQVLAECIHTCKTIIKQAMKAGQYHNAIGAMNTLSKLAKLDS